MSKNKKNKKSSKKKVVVIIIILIVIVAAAVTVPNFLNSNNAQQAANQMDTQQVEVTVEKGEIKVSVTGSGSIEPADKRIVKSEVSGTIGQIFVKEGQLVEEDEMILTYKVESDDESEQLKIQNAQLDLKMAQSDLNELYNQQAGLKVYADASGTIGDFNLEKGDDVSINENLLTINNVDIANLEVFFTKNQFDNISVGDSAELFFPDYLMYQSGKISSKNSTPVPLGSGAVGYAVIVEIDNMGAMEKGIEAQVTVENSNGKYTSAENGKIIETEKAIIKADTSGEISEVYIKDGQYINAGDLLLEITSDDLAHKIEQQRIVVDQKKIALDDLQEIESVYSPVYGTILSLNVDEDEAVDRMAMLATMANLDDMEVVIEVDELDIIKIKEGQEVEITSDVFEDEKFAGTVANIALEGQNSGGITTYNVTVKIDDRKELMSNMNVDVEVLVAEKSDALLLPIEAVQKVQSKYIVMVKNENDEITPNPIEVGLANEDYVEVISGLNEGDTVVYMIESNMSDEMSSMMFGPGMGGGQRNKDKSTQTKTTTKTTKNYSN